VNVRRVASCGGLLLLSLAAAARAHRVAHPKSDQVFVGHRTLLLLLRYQVAAGPDAERVRKSFDRDRDGALDEGERGRAAEFLAGMAVHRLALEVNGALAAPRRVGVAAWGLDLPTGASAGLGARALFEVPARWRVGLNRIVLRDRHKDQTVAVPAALHLAPPFELRHSSLGQFDAATRQVREVVLREGTTWEVFFVAPGSPR
jgi:hypothetical protein